MNIEISIKIIELIIAASVPILIAFWGYKLTKKMEDVKNKTAQNYYWESQWVELLFGKYKIYTEDVIALLCSIQFLQLKIDEKKQDSTEGRKLQGEVNSLTSKIFKEGNEIALLSETLLGKQNDIAKSSEAIYINIANMINKKEINIPIILAELNTLNNIIKKFTKDNYKI